MGQENNLHFSVKKIDILALSILIILVGFFASPLLRNIDKSFTLFPKNIPNFYACYVPGLIFKSSAAEFPRPPLWIPMLEGGRSQLEYPFDVSLNPLSFLIIFFGEIISMNISWYLFYLFAVCSMYIFTRHILKFNIFGSIISSLIFSMSGAFGYLFQNGNFYCKEVLLLPLLLFFFIKARDNNRYIILCSFILSLMLFSTILFFPVIFLFICLFTCISSFQIKNGKISLDSRYINVLARICLLTTLLSTIKVLPFLRFFFANNRISGTNYADSIDSANTFYLFFRRLFIPEDSGPGTMYLGVGPVILCLFSSIRYFSQIKSYLIILLIFIILSFGPNSPVDLHRFLWPLPFFNSIKEISKYYSVIIVFLMAILAGKSFAFFEKFRVKSFSNIVPAIIIAVIYCNLLTSNIGYFNVFDAKFDYKPEKGDLFHVKLLNIHQGDESIADSLLYFLSKKNIGLLDFDHFLKRGSSVMPKYYLLPKYAFLSPSTSIIVLPNPDYVGEARFLNTDNKVKAVNIEPNLISIGITMKQPDTLVINQNFDKYWRSNFGKIEDHEGLLSLKFYEPRDGVIRITYFPKLFFAGLGLSLATLIFSAYLLIKK